MDSSRMNSLAAYYVQFETRHRCPVLSLFGIMSGRFGTSLAGLSRGGVYKPQAQAYELKYEFLVLARLSRSTQSG